MSHLDADTANRFRRDFGIAQDTVHLGVSPGCDASSAVAWAKLVQFTGELGLDPFLEAFSDKVPFLQIFAGRVHTGELASRGNPVKSRTAEDYVRHVAQTFLNMGSQDPRLNSAFKIDFHLQRTLRAWSHTDPAPLRVKLLPVSVIRPIAVLATSDFASDTFKASCDMIIIIFFFLLRPGEYTDNNRDPFRLADTQLFIGDRRLDFGTAPTSELQVARFASLTYQLRWPSHCCWS